MKKSVTESKDMTFDEFIRLFIWPVYDNIVEYMVGSDDRIHFRGDTWLVILDHNTGDFYFSGELHKYYSIDTIQSIRDCFGDIYSVFNLKYDEVVRDTWIKLNYGDTYMEKTAYQLQFEDEEKKRKMLEYKKEYYIKHKEEISKKQKEYYKKKKQYT